MSEFTVDSEALALGWLDHHRDLWAGAYSVAIQPNSYPVHPTKGLVYSRNRADGTRTVITIQGYGLAFPDEADIGDPDEQCLNQALLIVSDDLAVRFVKDKPRSSEAA